VRATIAEPARGAIASHALVLSALVQCPRSEISEFRTHREPHTFYGRQRRVKELSREIDSGNVWADSGPLSLGAQDFVVGHDERERRVSLQKTLLRRL
jgi:hypothetical protein